MIKHPFIFVLSLILLVAAVGYAINRACFLHVARRVEGKVVSIVGTDSTCGARRSSHPCTEFKAKVEYQTPQRPTIYNINIDAGTAYGHFQPIDKSTRKLGQAVKVVYDGNAPYKAYQDSFWGVWSTPVYLMFLQVIAMFASFSNNRNGYDTVSSVVDIVDCLDFF